MNFDNDMKREARIDVLLQTLLFIFHSVIIIKMMLHNVILIIKILILIIYIN